jgi:hypothetical protein
MYHVRNHTPLAERTEGERKAKSQAQVILGFMRERADDSWGPHEIQRLLFDEQTPLTSIRRALTDLTNDGYLVKQVEKRTFGKYGVSNCTWTIADNKPQTELFR